MENKQIWGSETNTSENLFFEDNFDPVIHTNKTEFQKLNDSTEYLQLLENRLAKIKNDPTVLKQLREKREQCMRNLLDNGSASDFASQISLDRALVADEDTKTSEILRRINPQQALTVGEVVPIVKHDQLQKKIEEEEEEEEIPDNVSR